MDDIVGQPEADDFRAKAHGERPIAQLQLPGNDGQTQTPQPSGNSRPAVASGGGDGHTGSAPKFQLSAPSRAKQTERNQTEDLFGSGKPFGGLENDPDAFRRRILNDKLEFSETGHLAGAALGNEVKAVDQNVVQPAKETFQPLVDQSLDEGKRIVRGLVDDRPTTRAPIATDDLPPVQPIKPKKQDLD